MLPRECRKRSSCALEKEGEELRKKGEGWFGRDYNLFSGPILQRTRRMAGFLCVTNLMEPRLYRCRQKKVKSIKKTMKRLTEKRIRILSLVRAERGFKEKTKRSILGRERLQADLLMEAMIFRGGMVALMMLFLLLFSQLHVPREIPPFSHEREEMERKIEGVKEDNNVVKSGNDVLEIEKIKNDLATLEGNFRDVRNEILKSYIDDEGAGMKEEEIIDHHLQRIEEKGKGELLEDMKEDNEEEAFDTIIKILMDEKVEKSNNNY